MMMGVKFICLARVDKIMPSYPVNVPFGNGIAFSRVGNMVTRIGCPFKFDILLRIILRILLVVFVVFAGLDVSTWFWVSLSKNGLYDCTSPGSCHAIIKTLVT